MPIIHIEEFSRRSSVDIGSYSTQVIRNRQRNRVNRLPCDGVDCPRCPVSYSCGFPRWPASIDFAVARHDPDDAGDRGFIDDSGVTDKPLQDDYFLNLPSPQDIRWGLTRG
jgi:hypothetical protein